MKRLFTILLGLLVIGYSFACIDFTDSSTWGTAVTQDADGNFHVWENITLCAKDQNIEGHSIYIEANNTVIDFNGTARLVGSDVWTYTYDGDLFIIINKTNITFLNFSMYKLGGWDGIVAYNSSNIRVLGNYYIRILHTFTRLHNCTNITIAHMYDAVDGVHTSQNLREVMYFVQLKDYTQNVHIFDISIGYRKMYGGLVSFGYSTNNVTIENITAGRGCGVGFYLTDSSKDPPSNIVYRNVHYIGDSTCSIGFFEYVPTNKHIVNLTIENITVENMVTTLSKNALRLRNIDNLVVRNIHILRGQAWNSFMWVYFSDNVTIENIYLNDSSGTGLELNYNGYSSGRRGKITVRNVTMENVGQGLILYHIGGYPGSSISLQDIHINHARRGIVMSDYASSRDLITSGIYINDSYIGIWKRSSGTLTLSDVHINNSRGPAVFLDKDASVSITGLYIENSVPPFIAGRDGTLSVGDIHITNPKLRERYFSFSDHTVNSTMIWVFTADFLDGSDIPIKYDIFYDSLAGLPVENNHPPDVYLFYEPFDDPSHVGTSSSYLWYLSKASSTMWNVSNSCFNSQGKAVLSQMQQFMPSYMRTMEGLWLWGDLQSSAEQKVWAGLASSRTVYIESTDTTVINNNNYKTTIFDWPLFNGSSPDTVYHFFFGYEPPDGYWHEIVNIHVNNTYYGRFWASVRYYRSSGPGKLQIGLDNTDGGDEIPEKICGVIYAPAARYTYWTLSDEQYREEVLDSKMYNRYRLLEVYASEIYAGWSEGFLMLPSSYFGGDVYVRPRDAIVGYNISVNLVGGNIELPGQVRLIHSQLSLSSLNVNVSQALWPIFDLNDSKIYTDYVSIFSDSEVKDFITNKSTGQISMLNTYIWNIQLNNSHPSISLQTVRFYNVPIWLFNAADSATNIYGYNVSNFIIRGADFSNAEFESSANVLDTTEEVANITCSNVTGHCLYIHDTSQATLREIYITNADIGIKASNVSDSVLQSIAINESGYGLYLYSSTHNEIKYTHLIHNSYGIYVASSTLNSFDHNYLCSNSIVGIYFTSDSHDNQGSDNQGNMTDDDSNILFSITDTNCLEDYYVNVYVIGEVEYPPDKSIVPFEQYLIRVAVQDNYDSNCTLYNCSVEYAYTTDSYGRRSKYFSFVKEFCPGNNTINLQGISKWDFMDSAGNFVTAIPTHQEVHVVCKNPSTKQAIDAKAEYYVNIPEASNILLILLGVLTFVGVVVILYSDYGVVFYAGLLVMFLFTSTLMAQEGVVAAVFYKDVMMILFVLINLGFMLSIIKIALENRRQALEGL